MSRLRRIDRVAALAAGRGVMETLEENRELIAAALEAWAQMSRSEEVRIAMRKSYEEFHGAIALTTGAAFAELGEEDVDADAVATLIIAIVDGLLVRWQLDPDSAPSAEQLMGAADRAFAVLSGGGR